MTSKKYISTAMAVAMVASSVAPEMAATTTSNEEIIGKNRTETVKAENYGLNISGYSKESLSEVAREATIIEKVELMPSAELSQK